MAEAGPKAAFARRVLCLPAVTVRGRPLLPHTATPHLHCEPGPGCRNLSHVVAGRSNHSVQWHTENLTRTRTQGHGILVTRKLQPVGEAARGGPARARPARRCSFNVSRR